jgi:hypothetical protein
MSLPVSKLQIHAVESADPLASSELSMEISMHVISAECPTNVFTVPVSTSHALSSPPSYFPPVAVTVITHRPSLDTATIHTYIILMNIPRLLNLLTRLQIPLSNRLVRCSADHSLSVWKVGHRWSRIYMKRALQGHNWLQHHRGYTISGLHRRKRNRESPRLTVDLWKQRQLRSLRSPYVLLSNVDRDREMDQVAGNYFAC